MYSDDLSRVTRMLKEDDQLREQLLSDPGTVDSLPLSDVEKEAVREALAYREDHHLTNVFWA